MQYEVVYDDWLQCNKKGENWGDISLWKMVSDCRVGEIVILEILIRVTSIISNTNTRNNNVNYWFFHCYYHYDYESHTMTFVGSFLIKTNLDANFEQWQNIYCFRTPVKLSH